MGLNGTVAVGLENVGTIEVCVAVPSPVGDYTIELAFNVYIRAALANSVNSPLSL